MRVFIALEPVGTLRDALVDTQAALRMTVRGRYVPPDGLHLTLAFVGELAVPKVALVSECARDVARTHGPVAVTLTTVGSFGSARSATLWQGVEGEGLSALAAALRATLDTAGIAYDNKTFLPHVTLMRGADVTHGTLPMAACSSGTLDALCIYRSHLRPDGASYEVLERIPLTVGADMW